MNSITIVCGHPSNKLSPHANGHWHEKAELTKKAREGGYVAALAAMGGCEPPRWKAAKMHIRAFFADRCRWDQMNYIAALKAKVDGFADAGIVANDRGLRLGEVDLDGIDPKDPRVEITIEPVS